MKPLSLYFHIPFCARKCAYCDFLSFEHKNDLIKSYLIALRQEIVSYEELLQNYEIKTIYIGGGTPSLMTEVQTENIMEQINKSFHIASSAEITIECNPGTLTKEKLLSYKALGINRISIGLQSTEDEELKSLGRIHTLKEFESNFHTMREIGYDNINVDMIFGLPNQTIKSWRKSLEYIKALDPEHISLYGLIIEEGTAFHKRFVQNQSPLPNEEEERQMYWEAHRELIDVGYCHYEISNYSKENYMSRHNTVYWTMEEYIGMGLGASSYFQGMRKDNLRDLQKYIHIGGDLKKLHAQVHPVTVKEKKEEFLFLGLRLLKGIDRRIYKKMFSEEIEKSYGDSLDELAKEGLIQNKDSFIFLTKKGIDLSNYVFTKFLLD